LATPHLQLDTSEQRGRAVLTVRGELDLATAPLLQEQIDALAEAPIVDLTGVDFVDSTGLRVLITAHDTCGGLPLVVRDGPVTRLFDLTGVRERLLVFDSLAAALGDG
jgi:anti-anti-sigma factor